MIRTFPSLPREQWRRNRLAINVATAMVFAGFTFVMPFLPLYVKELGVQGDAAIASWSGLLITVAPLIAAVLGPAWGRLGDRYGMKIMVERCMLALAIHWALFGFARNTYHLLILRVMLGVFGGFQSLATPLLVASTPKEHMSRSIGRLQAVQMISSAAGPLVGGFLADWAGIRFTCLLSAAFSAVGLILINRLYQELPPLGIHKDARPTERRITLKHAIAFPSFGAMITIMFFVNFIERSFTPVVPLYILQLGTSLKNAAKTSGLVLSLGLFSEAVSASVIGSRLKTVAARRLLLWRLSGGLVVSLPIGFVWATSQLLVLRLLLGLLAGGCMVVIYTLGSHIIPAETRGTSFAFLSGAALMGSAVGPIVAGTLANINLRATFFFNSLVFLFLLVLAWCSVGEHRPGAEIREKKLALRRPSSCRDEGFRILIDAFGSDALKSRVVGSIIKKPGSIHLIGARIGPPAEITKTVLW